MIAVDTNILVCAHRRHAPFHDAAARCVMVGEGPGYWPLLRELSTAARIAGALVHDARVAAICRFHGVRELWTVDRDFNRFDGVVVRNPLVTEVAREPGSSYGGRRVTRRQRRAQPRTASVSPA